MLSRPGDPRPRQKSQKVHGHMTAVYLCRSAGSSIRHQSRVWSVGSAVERRKTSCCAHARTYGPTDRSRGQREVCEYQRADSRRVAMEPATEHVASKTHTTHSRCTSSIATSSISSLGCVCNECSASDGRPYRV